MCPCLGGKVALSRKFQSFLNGRAPPSLTSPLCSSAPGGCAGAGCAWPGALLPGPGFEEDTVRKCTGLPQFLGSRFQNPLPLPFPGYHNPRMPTSLCNGMAKCVPVTCACHPYAFNRCEDFQSQMQCKCWETAVLLLYGVTRGARI